MNVAHLLTAQARQRPGATAIVERDGGDGSTISFAELDERSSRCARFLADAGLGTGDHVLVFVPMSIDLYVALIAIFRIGAVAVFLDPSAGADHINRCCELIDPGAMIAIAKAHLLRLTSVALRRIPRKFTVGWPIPGVARLERARSCSALASIAARSEDDPALVTFTSGSTGLPKGAVRSHGFLAAQHASLQRAIELVPGEIDLSTLPIFSLANLASGVSSVIPDADPQHPGSIDGAPVLRQIAAHRVSRCVASPAFFERLLDAPGAQSALSGMKRIDTGGAPVFPGLLDRLQRAMPNARVSAVYGSTEAEPIAEISRQDISADDQRAMFSGAGLLAGRPVPDIDLRIIPNQSGCPLPPVSHFQFEQSCLSPRQPGEIVVHGKHVLRGYLGGRGEEQTKWRVDDQIWHRTGDAGYLDETGRLWLLGRAEATLQDEHGTVYPFAVECAASRTEGVARSALIQIGKKRLLAVQRTDPAPSDLETTLLRDLAWARIQETRFLPRLPLDKRHNAKIDYPALRRLLGSV
jgi:acyl-CoA synthetase (AMP-forming)/AMP-acid ligase II